MPALPTFPKLSRYKTAAAFSERLAELALDLSVDDEILTADQG